MSIFDYSIIFITSVCCLFSFNKGMVREIFSLLGYLVGYVLSIDYYFAKDIGLIKADAVQGYAVDDTFIALLELIPGFELTIPTSLSVTNVQDIDSFVVN